MSNTEFGIVEEKCPFCGQEKVVQYDEHYYFCPGCVCIYTFPMVIESNCEHIKDGAPTLIHAGRHKIPDRSVPFIFELSGTQLCSICNKTCIADGW